MTERHVEAEITIERDGTPLRCTVAGLVDYDEIAITDAEVPGVLCGVEALTDPEYYRAQDALVRAFHEALAAEADAARD